MRDQEMVCLENEKLIKKVEECEQFHSFGGKSKVSDLVRHRKNGSNTSLPEMINNNNFKQVHYDSSSAVSPFNLYITQARLWACGRGDVSTPSFGSHPNPISTRGGRLCPPYTGVHTKF